MSVLVTGAHGYIGSSFINRYYNKYAFTTFSSLEDEMQSLDLSGVKCIVHCAALVHQKKETAFERYSEVNVKYPLDLALKAKASGVGQFIFLSTIAVYGESCQSVSETTSTNPVTPYGKSKLEAEQKLLELADEYFVVSILRAPMVYGKNAPGNMALLVRLIGKISFLPLGGITNKRSFVGIDNLCYTLHRLIEKKQNGIFLASDDESIGTSELIKLLAVKMHKRIFLLQIPFFEILLKSLKPTLHVRLFQSLEVDNHITKKSLDLQNPYTLFEGITMIFEEKR